MKPKNDYILGSPGSVVLMKCRVCGIDTNSAPYLIYWRDSQGTITCSNCYCEEMKNEYDALLQENTNAQKKSYDMIQRLIESNANHDVEWSKRVVQLETELKELKEKI